MIVILEVKTMLKRELDMKNKLKMLKKSAVDFKNENHTMMFQMKHLQSICVVTFVIKCEIVDKDPAFFQGEIITK